MLAIMLAVVCVFASCDKPDITFKLEIMVYEYGFRL